MRYTDERSRLQVEIDPAGCQVPTDELTRMQESLDPLSEAVQGYPNPELRIKVIRHPNVDDYQVEAKLQLPARSFSTADRDMYLDLAFQRCLHKLTHRVEGYKLDPEEKAAVAAAQRVSALEQNVVIPEGIDAGPLGKAVEAGDYCRFRNTLVGYEDWLRKRVGRWVQRYPEAERQVGNGLKIGDLVEEVYLNAFESYPGRPAEVSLSDWLDSLIDPSLRALLRHPDAEQENASMARSLRGAPVAGK